MATSAILAPTYSDTKATDISTWNVDPAHSHVEFAVPHLMISTVKGRFGTVQGKVTAPSGDFSRGQIDVTIDAKTIDTRQEQRDAHLRSPDFLDVEHFPAITFSSREILPAGEGNYQIIGDLTIHGVTREVTLSAAKDGEGPDPWGGERMAFSAKTRINRRDFGLLYNQLLETGGVAVGDEIKISIDTELVKAA